MRSALHENTPLILPLAQLMKSFRRAALRWRLHSSNECQHWLRHSAGVVVN
ncbi:hypothetical protein [Mycetohabitans endofungorum]|uniref:hypothetical protein n=1 Tax=Mycetohabitans endofungorum TaxID=417203 RepID=UPI002B05755E|nr:hypothetical protein [Mycetohabitans endofungorum]